MPKQHSLGTHTRRPSHATPKREGRRTILDGGKPSANIRSSEASLYAVNTLPTSLPPDEEAEPTERLVTVSARARLTAHAAHWEVPATTHFRR